MAEFQQGDNPADHTVEEVNAYLAREDVSAEEKQAILDAEQGEGGKNRSTVSGPAAHNQAPTSDETVTDADTAEGGEDEETVNAYGGSKPYWYEETQGPAPDGTEETHTIVRVQRPGGPSNQ